jgi:TPR repeat protein
MALVVGLLTVLGATVAQVAPAEAQRRHAFLVGVGAYKDNSGLAKLVAPPNDVEQLAALLAGPGIGFDITTLKDDEVPNKAAFEQAFRRFLRGVGQGDEVLFYFSGHGVATAEKNNVFLLADAKGQAAFIRDLTQGNSPAAKDAARDLTSNEARERRYHTWLADVGISQQDVEAAIRGAGAAVTVMVIDACRSLVAGAKTPTLGNAGGLGLPVDMPDGVFRILSAMHGQFSLDAPDAGPARSGDKKGARRELSLFTRVLMQELQVPNLEINTLFKQVRIKVRDQARALGHTQIPDYHESPEASNWFFRRADAAEISGRCFTAPNELRQLQFSASFGAVSRDQLLRKQGELAPCGQSYVAEIEKLLRFESQGAGALSTTDLKRFANVGAVTEPLQRCDLFGSSPFDPNRPQGISGFDVHQIALEAMKAPGERAAAIEGLKQTMEACETAVQTRGRVARYRFNLARAHYAYATLTDQQIERDASLAVASRSYQDAADAGYVAAYNDLAVLHQNGDYWTASANGSSRAAPDRRRAFELFRRGADLGHVVAQYNLGLAYKNGELGIVVPVTGGSTRGETTQVSISTRNQLAYQYLSRAAEAGFVPAMIETALLQNYEPDLPGNKARATELLEIAASRGSWEAMYQLGRISFDGGSSYAASEFNRDASIDFADAVVWFSRAAEAGDTRAQTQLARLLMSGEGLPAQQPEAAARYLRLAAAAGSVDAQLLLADRLRDGKMSFRPRTDGKLDGGAAEIRELYFAAFSRGSPRAGLELARLFRTGFPLDRPSQEIPKSAEIAARLLWDTIDKVRAADPSSADASPETEAWAAVELIKMYDVGDARGIGGPDAISQDQIEQLKADYGDVAKLKYIRTSAVGAMECRNRQYWALVWDGRGTLAMLDRQFDWFERYGRCKEPTPIERERLTKAKIDLDKWAAERGIPKKTRDVFKREFEAAAKDKEKKRTFVDRMVDLVSPRSAETGRNRR